MKTIVETSLESDVSPDAVWAVIRKVDGIDQILPQMVTQCSISEEVPSVGTQRYCTMQDGTQLEEEILILDDEAMRIQYSVYSDALPFKDMVNTGTVERLESGRTKITWKSEFRPEGLSADEAKEMLTGMLKQSIVGYESAAIQ